MRKTILFINAGHGGTADNGDTMTDPTAGKKTLHTNNKFYHNGSWFYEGTSNRDFAMEFIIEATKAGFICVPVFEAQRDTPRSERISFANAWAKGKKSVWLSFHSNATGNSTAPQTVAEGVCAFVSSLTSAGGQLAALMLPAIESVFDKWASKRRAQLVHTKALDETALTLMPSILFELGFFDNPKNADLLINPQFRAEVIAVMVQKLKENLI
jgi:N-acetylmuramoyl-L-alanine amidase